MPPYAAADLLPRRRRRRPTERSTPGAADPCTPCPAPRRERFELALASPGGGGNEADGGSSGAGAGSERYRFSRCRRPLPAAAMAKLGVPLPEGERSVVHDDLAWEEIQVRAVWLCGPCVCVGLVLVLLPCFACCLCCLARLRAGRRLHCLPSLLHPLPACEPLTCPLSPSPSPCARAVGHQRREPARRDVPAGPHPLCAADGQARGLGAAAARERGPAPAGGSRAAAPSSSLPRSLPSTRRLAALHLALRQPPTLTALFPARVLHSLAASPTSPLFALPLSSL